MTDKLIRGSGGGGGCFAAGTFVATPKGYRDIETLKVGDEVIAFTERGELVTETVEICHVHENEEIWVYRFWNGLEVKATPNHWVLNQFGNFAEIGTLTEQDAIIDGDGHIRPLVSKEYVENAAVFNLTVSGSHTYIANNIRVHNTGSGEGRLSATIRGSGGGGGKGGGGGARTAVEAPDSLRSKAYASVLDLISEGEIEGLVSGLQSVYLDETPIQNPDGTNNFSGATVYAVNGTQAQSYIPGFTTVENETAVGVEVKNSSSVTRQITNAEIDAVRVRISVPQLTQQNTTNGDINGATVQYAIDVQSNGGGFVPQTLSSAWRAETVQAVSALHYRATRSDATQIQMTIRTYSTITYNFVVEYKLLTDTTWSTAGITNTVDVQDITQRPWNRFGDDYYAEPEQTLAYTTTYTMPVKPDGVWEMRVRVVSGEAPQLVSAIGNTGAEFATISGKTTSKYERSHRIALTGEAPWDIRIRRLTADSTSSALQNKTFWESFTEIVDAKLRYPNSAIVGVRIDSSQFSQIPRRGYDVKLLRVRIPSNYNPVTRVYTGVWDGTFKVAWTDNPAWCFYDLLTNDRYGLGGLIDDTQVDKWALYSVARYCDELVPNGFGGTEPRFTCNIYMQSRAEAYRVIQDMASIFRGMVYWQAGAITVSQDAPSDPVNLFTPANVIDGQFTYSGSSAKARHTVALVTWNDPDDFFRQKVEYVEDAAGIARYGIIQTEVTAIGCSSRGQANRVGRWLLLSEQSESDVVIFKTGIEGATARPGQVIQIADPTRAGARRGGRIVTATAGTVTLDSTVSLTGTGHKIAVILPNGAVEEREVASVTGVLVTTVSNFSMTPVAGAIWVMQSPNLEAQSFKVISAVESEDGIEINALAHNPAKYDAIETDLTLQPRAISNLSIATSAPTNIRVSEALYESSAEVRTLVIISWDSVQGATSYRVSYKVDEGNFVSLPETGSNSIEIRDAKPGAYVVNVVAVNAIGKRSPTAEANATIAGKTAPPGSVQAFSLVPMAGSAYLSWNKSTDLDVLVGGTVRIRHTPDTTGQDWNNSVDILPAMSGNQTNATAPLLAGTYMAKFVDSSGFSSVDPALIITTVPEAIALNAVETVTESPAFSGSKSGVVYDDAADGIILGGADTIDDRLDLIDSWEFLDTLGGVASSGTYFFNGSVDLGAVYPTRLTARIRATGFDTGSVWDYRTAFIDEWLDVDGARADSANATLYMRTTNDNPAGTPTWSVWKPFFASSYTARGFQFKVELTSGNPTHNISVTDLQVTVDMEDRVQALDNVVSGTGTYSVIFSEPFWATPSVGITAEAMASGDYYTISNKTPSGFDIIFKNSAGTTISRTFDVFAKGYGRQVTI